MLKPPYVLFVGDARDQLAAKTAVGVQYWRPQMCIGQIRLDGCRARLELPVMTIADACAAGARTLIVGLANAGGTISESWLPTLTEALAAGLHLASGLHQRLTDIPSLCAAAAASGCSLIDVRHPRQAFAVGTGARRSGRRLLTVGTDCSVGKMYTALAIERELHKRGMAADFRATGQTGIFIAGDGVSVDAVVADFISGAVEELAPANAPDHWDVIEGQGSLFHPSFAGVSLGLLHGAQAEALVMCHEPTRTHMRGLPHQPMPALNHCIAANEAAARLTQPDARCIGVAVNTSGLTAAAAADTLERLADASGLPCVDPVAGNVAPLVERLLA
ncbi:MAG: DUF1611 domain-containing protein [Defluviicoccus sp.]|nr:DUF1611 domain-containing protein [Defluviicoccus sp.]MDG4608149.1 DUF1611 domain-containing protein [Defluviicoccus sp.]